MNRDESQERFFGASVLSLSTIISFVILTGFMPGLLLFTIIITLAIVVLEIVLFFLLMARQTITATATGR